MKRKSIFLTFGLLVLSWIGCVENDLPYPTIVGQITEMEVAGMTSCRILGASNTVEIKVADTIDLRDLRVEKLVVTEGMKVYPDSAACLDIAHFPDTGFVSADSLPAGMDTRMNFLNPVKFRLSLYQDYDWTVNVSRDIVRKIKIKNQVGSALIDDYTKNVIVYVDSTEQPSLRNIEIEELQLGTKPLRINTITGTKTPINRRVEPCTLRKQSTAINISMPQKTASRKILVKSSDSFTSAMPAPRSAIPS